MAGLGLSSLTPWCVKTGNGLTPPLTGIAFSRMRLSGALVRPLVGKFSDHIGRRPLCVAGNVIAAVAAACIALASGPAAASGRSPYLRFSMPPCSSLYTAFMSSSRPDCSTTT